MSKTVYSYCLHQFYLTSLFILNFHFILSCLIFNVVLLSLDGNIQVYVQYTETYHGLAKFFLNAERSESQIVSSFFFIQTFKRFCIDHKIQINTCLTILFDFVL